MPPFLPGLELSRRLYTEAVRPLLDGAIPGIPHSTARLGSSSEARGYDIPRSTDHDWGPRLQPFLRPEDADTTAPASLPSSPTASRKPSSATPPTSPTPATTRAPTSAS